METDSGVSASWLYRGRETVQEIDVKPSKHRLESHRKVFELLNPTGFDGFLLAIRDEKALPVGVRLAAVEYEIFEGESVLVRDLYT